MSKRAAKTLKHAWATRVLLAAGLAMSFEAFAALPSRADDMPAPWIEEVGEFALEGGLHQSQGIAPIVGLSYRREWTNTLAWKVGVDTAYPAFPAASLYRIKGALMLATPVYAGLGLTYLGASPTTGLGVAGTLSPDAVIGLRAGVESILLGAELRLGLSNINSLTASVSSWF